MHSCFDESLKRRKKEGKERRREKGGVLILLPDESEKWEENTLLTHFDGVNHFSFNCGFLR